MNQILSQEQIKPNTEVKFLQLMFIIGIQVGFFEELFFWCRLRFITVVTIIHLIIILQLLNHQEICVDTSEEILFVFFCLLNRRKFILLVIFFFLCLEYIVVQLQLTRQSSNYSLSSFSLLWPELA